MGSCCSSDDKKQTKLLRKTILRYYSTTIEPSFKEYKFDSAVQDQFASRVARENNTTVQIAIAWVKYYIAYMVYVGWVYGYESKKNPNTKPNMDLSILTVVPYEILQVWKCHILFTNKYQEFCKIITNNKKEFIPFAPPKKFWKATSIENLQKTFRFNHEMVLNFYPAEKKEIDSLFIFQASYLKNRINYCLEDNSETLVNITTKFNEELAKKDGVFSIRARSLPNLLSLANKIEDLVKSAIVPENYPGGEDWLLYDPADKTAALKIPVFQHLVLPADFADNFCEDHILSREKGAQYIDNYKKFLFLMPVTKKSQTPSEEVDLVWHYHQLYVDDYLKFSKDVMGTQVLSHMPAIGEKDESSKFKEQYEATIASLVKYFGSANPNIWPDSTKRFSQSFKYFNHHNILQRCENYNKQNSKTKNPIIQKNEVYFIPGCYIGCGVIYSTAFVGCGAVVGCGAIVGCSHAYSACATLIPHSNDVVNNACNSGGSGCHTACSGGNSGCSSSGCSSGGGASGCSSGGSGCGGSGCGGSGCGGGGCGGGCGGG